MPSGMQFIDRGAFPFDLESLQIPGQLARVLEPSREMSLYTLIGEPAKSYVPGNDESDNLKKVGTLSEIINLKLAEKYNHYFSSLSGKEFPEQDRKQVFENLIVEMYQLSDRYPQLKGPYFEACHKIFKLDGDSSAAIQQAATKAAHSTSTFDREWRESLSRYLSEATLESEAWCIKRHKYLCEKLDDHDFTFNLGATLDAEAFKGYQTFLRRQPEQLTQLRKFYKESLDELMFDANAPIDPYSVYSDLHALGMLGYLDSQYFKVQRDNCLRTKFKDGNFLDLDKYLAFYARDTEDLRIYDHQELDALEQMQGDVKDAVLKAVRRGQKKYEHAVKLAIDLFLPGDFTRQPELVEAVIVGTSEILNRGRAIKQSAFGFAALLDSKDYPNIAWPKEIRQSVRVIFNDVIETNNFKVEQLLRRHRDQDTPGDYGKLRAEIAEGLSFVAAIKKLKKVFGVTLNFIPISLSDVNPQLAAMGAGPLGQKVHTKKLGLPLGQISPVSLKRANSKIYNLRRQGKLREAVRLVKKCTEAIATADLGSSFFVHKELPLIKQFHETVRKEFERKAASRDPDAELF